MTTEEKAKAYDDGWNNCNMQHSQCKSELDDVLKCLINGMKFYYEDNKDATWGTDKWSMPVKHIIEVLEKQGEKKSTAVWHSVSESPDEMKELLCEWESDDATWHDVAFYHADTKTFWNGERQVIGVTRWCYIDEMVEKQGEQASNDIEIPFGAKDSELYEETYHIPKGFHAEIDGDKVIIKKGEQFIQDCTKNCSNELCAVEDRCGKKVISYHEWLTPEQALRAVELARKEMIEKAVEWLYQQLNE